ncbi:hypothetical protein ACFQZE_15440 [Paenibacillus sp. GCM10027627]|uniref:hypothetical protein n=1 Tax=unclassified Paenibacillus TaxID=185978 RepID=UPI00362796A3
MEDFLFLPFLIHMQLDRVQKKVPSKKRSYAAGSGRLATFFLLGAHAELMKNYETEEIISMFTLTPKNKGHSIQSAPSKRPYLLLDD